MNPHQFHIEHGRLQFAELERAAMHRHESTSRRRRRATNPLAGRFHLRFGRVGRAGRVGATPRPA
jgi:hypothetical protein